MTHRPTRASFLAAVFVMSLVPALAGVTWTIQVAADGSLTFPPGVDLTSGRVVELEGDSLSLTFLCPQAGADCAGLELTLDGRPWNLAVSPDKKTATGNIPADSSKPSRVVTATHGQRQPMSLHVAFRTPARPQLASTGTAGLLARCNGPLDAIRAVEDTIGAAFQAYDQKGNHAEMIVSPVGAVYERFRQFDEDDTLTVWVYGHADVLNVLQLDRTSKVRTPGQYRIIGDAELGKVRRESLASDACAVRSWTLNDFAPGTGTVAISRFDTDPRKTLGTLEFVVNPLYSGIFSLGGIWTDLVDPELTVASNGTDDVILAGAHGEDDFEYALFFTPFVWGKRDLEKPPEKFYHRLNPSMGVFLQDVDENALLGVSLDLPRGILLTYGRHFRRISSLDEGSGLAVGDVFAGTEGDLPLSRSWEDEAFWGFSIDLRAAAKLFKGVFTANGP